MVLICVHALKREQFSYAAQVVAYEGYNAHQWSSGRGFNRNIAGHRTVVDTVRSARPTIQ